MSTLGPARAGWLLAIGGFGAAASMVPPAAPRRALRSLLGHGARAVAPLRFGANLDRAALRPAVSAPAR